METTVKMVQKEVTVETWVGVPTYNKKGELIFRDSTDIISLNILIPEELTGEDKEEELKDWFNKQWRYAQCDVISAHSVYLEENHF